MPSIHVLTKNYSSKFTIMSFWTPAQKSRAGNGIPKNILLYCECLPHNTWLQ